MAGLFETLDEELKAMVAEDFEEEHTDDWHSSMELRHSMVYWTDWTNSNRANPNSVYPTTVARQTETSSWDNRNQPANLSESVKQCHYSFNFPSLHQPQDKINVIEKGRLTVGADMRERFSTVALSSSTLALIGVFPLLRGLISTRNFRSLSSSDSESELE